MKRIAFGSREEADGFVGTMSGWSVIGDDDPDWMPPFGTEGGPVEWPARP